MLTKKDADKTEVKNNKTSKNANLSDKKTQTSVAVSPPRAVKAYTDPNQELLASNTNPMDRKNQKTRITVKYDVGFNNQLYIRGKGLTLSWDKGLPLKNTKSDEWVWEAEGNTSHFEFKVLVNDKQYEIGENHHLNAGATIAYSPHF